MALPNERILPHDFVAASGDYARSFYHLVIPRRWSFFDLTDPELWKRQTKLRSGDVIDVVGEAGDFDCTLRVVTAENGFAIMCVLRTWFASAPEHGEAGGPSVQLVLNQGWTLFDSSGVPIARFGSEEEALAELAKMTSAEVAQ